MVELEFLNEIFHKDHSYIHCNLVFLGREEKNLNIESLKFQKSNPVFYLYFSYLMSTVELF